ncbi:hypothetical protein RUND412_000306 [Rhizina undulata]
MTALLSPAASPPYQIFPRQNSILPTATYRQDVILDEIRGLKKAILSQEHFERWQINMDQRIYSFATEISAFTQYLDLLSAEDKNKDSARAQNSVPESSRKERPQQSVRGPAWDWGPAEAGSWNDEYARPFPKFLTLKPSLSPSNFHGKAAEEAKRMQHSIEEYNRYNAEHQPFPCPWADPFNPIEKELHDARAKVHAEIEAFRPIAAETERQVDEALDFLDSIKNDDSFRAEIGPAKCQQIDDYAANIRVAREFHKGLRDVDGELLPVNEDETQEAFEENMELLDHFMDDNRYKKQLTPEQCREIDDFRATAKRERHFHRLQKLNPEILPVRGGSQKTRAIQGNSYTDNEETSEGEDLSDPMDVEEETEDGDDNGDDGKESEEEDSSDGSEEGSGEGSVEGQKGSEEDESDDEEEMDVDEESGDDESSDEESDDSEPEEKPESEDSDEEEFEIPDFGDARNADNLSIEEYIEKALELIKDAKGASAETNLKFYHDTIAGPSGLHFTKLCGLDDEELDDLDSYIEWLFPLPCPSAYAPGAPSLTKDTAVAFRKQSELRFRMRTAFIRMLELYGFRRTKENGKVKIVPRRHAKYEWASVHDKHHRLIFRILYSLRFFGMSEEAWAFHAALNSYCDKHEEDGPSEFSRNSWDIAAAAELITSTPSFLLFREVQLGFYAGTRLAENNDDLSGYSLPPAPAAESDPDA